MRILTRQVFRAYAGTAADSHMLQYTVIDEGERLAIARGEQEDESTVGAGFAAVLLLGPVAVRILWPRPWCPNENSRLLGRKENTYRCAGDESRLQSAVC